MHKTKNTDGPLPHLFFEPEKRPEGPLSLIVFLHGHDEGGDGEPSGSLGRLEKCGLPEVAAEDKLPPLGGREFPMSILAPQAPIAEGWDPYVKDGRLLDLIKHVADEHDVDPSHVYLTGLSNGATAAWKLAALEPDRFAAFVPMSPAYGKVPEEAGRTSKLPTKVFAGEREKRYGSIKAGVDRLIAAGADVTFLPVPGEEHTRRLWRMLYKRADLYEWMLDHGSSP